MGRGPGALVCGGLCDDSQSLIDCFRLDQYQKQGDMTAVPDRVLLAP